MKWQRTPKSSKLIWDRYKLSRLLLFLNKICHNYTPEISILFLRQIGFVHYRKKQDDYKILFREEKKLCLNSDIHFPD